MGWGGTTATELMDHLSSSLLMLKLIARHTDAAGVVLHGRAPATPSWAV
jgi:hypothetical protein